MTTTDSSVPTATEEQPAHDDALAHPGPDAAAPASALAPPAPTSAAPTVVAAGSRLGPGEDFPEDLTGCEMAVLQVLHSRITRQIDHDYLTDPTGPHPATTDRALELVAELDARDTA